MSHYDGTPVTDGGAVTVVNTIMHRSGQSDASASGPQSHPVLNGIAQFELFLGVNAHSFTLTVSVVVWSYKDRKNAKSESAVLCRK